MPASRITKPIMNQFTGEPSTMTLTEMLVDFKKELDGYDHRIELRADPLGENSLIYTYSFTSSVLKGQPVEISTSARTHLGETRAYIHDELIAQLLRFVVSNRGKQPLPLSSTPTP